MMSDTGDREIIMDTGNVKIALIQAVESEDEDEVERLIDAGADVDETDDRGKTALFYANKKHNMSMVCQLICAGSLMNINEIYTKEVLFYAIKHEIEEVVQKLIDAEVAVDETDNRGINALFQSVFCCNETIVRLLVEKGKAFVNARDLYGRTPLFYAITKSKDIARYLIQQGGDVKLKDFSNRSVLSFFVENCVMEEKNTPLSFEELLSAKTDEFNMFNKVRNKQLKHYIKTILGIVICKLPLMCAVDTKIPQPFHRARDRITKSFSPALKEALSFAERGSDIKNITGDILKAWEENKVFTTAFAKEVIAFLVKMGANPNFADSDGNTALHYATCLPWMGVPQETVKEICRKLQSLGVPLDKKNHLGQTPLLFCLSGSIEHLEEEDKLPAMKTLVEVCKFLVLRGSMLEETTQDGESVFHLVIKLFQEIFEKTNETIRQDIIQQMMKILHLFSCDRLMKGNAVSKRDSRLNSPLHYWASITLPITDCSNNESFQSILKGALEHLLKLGATLNARNENEKTPLHICKTWCTVKLLLARGANPDDLDLSGRSPLFYAVQQSNNESVVQALIDAGADVNITDIVSKTALFYAVQQSNNESVVQALIDAGADVNKTNCIGETTLFYAVRQSNESVVRALIDAHADVNITDDDGQTVLFCAVRQSNNGSVVRALIDAHADVNITDDDGQTVLFCAVRQSNNGSVVRALIDAHADVNITDDDGQTVLFYAVRQSNNENVVRALIDAGVDPNITDDDGQTALFYSVQQINNESMVRALIDAGVDPNITDDDGQTALFYSVRQSNNENVVRALIDAGVDPNITDDDGQTALFYSVQQINNESMVRALIDSGADVNKTNSIGETTLFYAVRQSNNESVVRALVDARVDVHKTDNVGQTALFYAVQQSNNESVVRALIDAHADVNITDDNGQTAGGAFINVRDAYGRTPLFYALDYPTSAGILVDKDRKQLFRWKDNVNCSIMDVFVDRRLFRDDIAFPPSYITPYGFFHLLEECEVQNIKFAEAILSITFCKFPLMFKERSVFDRQFGSYYSMTHITSALELASRFIDNQEETELLIALINEKCKNGEGVSEALEQLVELGADPNSVGSDGNTALHYATGLAWMGVPQELVMEICLELEKLGAQFNSRNHENQSPLVFCLSGDMGQIQQGNQLSAVITLVEVCRFLLKCGSSIDERSRSGETVFHLMIKIFQQGLLLSDQTIRQDVLHEAIKFLQLFSPEKIAKTGIVNIPDANLNSPLHLWASLELPSPQDYTSNVTRDLTFEEFLQTILNYFLKCGAKLNARNGYDQTPLHLCSTWIAVKLMLDAGANANDVDSSKASPLIAVAMERWSFSDYQGGLYPDVAELEDQKSFWKTVIDKGLDPWTSDKDGGSVLSILIGEDAYVLAKALVDVACEEGHTQSETFAVGLLNAICKDKSTRTNWKTVLVQDILKSRKGPTTASEPLRLCCWNIIKTGVLDNKAEEKSPSAAIEMSASEDDETIDEGQPQSKKRRMDTSDHSIEVEFENSSVHCEIIKILRLYGADGKSCLDMADTSDALKELLTKPLDLSTMSVLIPWTSVSKKYEVKLAKVARRQDYDVIHEEFWCHKEHIGSGSFGHVFVGINEKDGREVAIKRIEKLRMQRPEDKREITNLTALADCEQVVRYLYFFEEEKFTYIVLELMEGNLDEYLTDASTFDTIKSTQLCKDVVKGLKFLHEQNIIHRDLKPGNILHKTHPHLCLKIADFGLSRRIESSTTTVYGTNAGTRCWMAPEVLKGTHDHSKASDMFSCGLILHYILSTQKHPFSPSDCASKGEYQIANETEANIMKGNLEGWDRSIQLEATHLIQKMLECDKDKRPSAAESLDHPLFWSNEKKVDLLIAVGNQSVFGYPSARGSTSLTPVEADLEKSFSTIVVYGKWNDPRYKDMPPIYAEMTSKRKYDTHSVVELVQFIRYAYVHVSETTRSATIRKMLLEDFVFGEYFPHLVMEVYKAVTDHGWDQTVEEIKYAMNK